MRIRRSILLAAAAAICAGPALAQDDLPPYAGDPVYGETYGGAVGGTYGAADGGWYEGSTYEGSTYEGGYTGEPVYFDESDAGADYDDSYDDGYDDGYGADYDDGYLDEPPYAPPPRAVVEAPAYSGSHGQPGARRLGYSEEQRANWLRRCRAVYSRDNDDGLGGALIGGVVGGVVGNRVAGRGNRTVGTVVGAGVGALAGASIDRAEDRGRAMEICEDYLGRYETYYTGGYDAGYAYGYTQPAPMSGPGVRRFGYDQEQRADWLRRCRAVYTRDNDDGLGGALIGGVVGGVVGNRVAGRGNRTVGTVVGAGVGALAGASIDRAEDRGRAMEICEDYLERYETYYTGGSYDGGYTPSAPCSCSQSVDWAPTRAAPPEVIDETDGEYWQGD